MGSLIARAGHFVKQPTGYRAFIPALLPPDPLIGAVGVSGGDGEQDQTVAEAAAAL